MALGINKVTLLGNVGHEPEIRMTHDGKEFATFWLATTETWRDKSTGDKKENTQWHRVVAFSEGLVEILRNYVKKGSRLFLEGSLRTRKFPDASSGQERSTTEVILQGNSVLILLDSKRGKDEETAYGNAQDEEVQKRGDSFGAGKYNASSSRDLSQNSHSKSESEAELDDSIPF